MSSTIHARALALIALVALPSCAVNKAGAKSAEAAPEIVMEDVPSTPPAIERTELSPDTWVYRHPRKTPRDYAKVIIAPVRIYENMVSEIKKRDRRNLNDVGLTFSNRLRRLMEKQYLPVEQPDEMTMRIEIELFELKPTTRIFKDRRERVKLGKTPSGTKLEASCYDSETNELIFAMSTFYEGEEYAAYEKPVLIKNLRGAFGEWSQYFMKRFDEVMAFN